MGHGMEFNSTGDLEKIAGINWPITPFFPFLINCKFVRIQNLNLGSGNQLIGTPPSGKKWMVVSLYVVNRTAGTINYYVQARVSGVDRKISNAQGLVTNSSNYPVLADHMCFYENSVPLSVNTSASGLHFFWGIVEFDATSPVRTVHTAINSGNNTVYTCPSNTTAIGIPNLWFYPANQTTSQQEGMGALRYFNASGSAKSVYACHVTTGSAVAPGGTSSNALQPAALNVNNDNAFTWGVPSMQATDFMVVNSNGSGTQQALINVLELPA